MEISHTSRLPVVVSQHTATSPLRAAVVRLEAAFLAEMLKAAGLGQARDEFGGGPGEDQFATFLVQRQAEHIAQAGGIGLAETFFNALKETQNGT